MALTECKECGKQISDKAKACPHCGADTSANWELISRGCGTSLLLLGFAGLWIWFVFYFLLPSLRF